MGKKEEGEEEVGVSGGGEKGRARPPPFRL